MSTGRNIFTIRTAISTDAEMLKTVQIKSWRGTYRGIVDDSYMNQLEERITLERWRHNLETQDQQVTFLIFDGTVGIGFATVGPSRDKRFSGVAELWSIYIDPAFFNGGAGTHLLRACFAHAAGHGYDRMHVRVLEDNVRGRAFYERRGASLVPESRGQCIIGEKEYPEVHYEWTDLRITP